MRLEVANVYVYVNETTVLVVSRRHSDDRRVSSLGDSGRRRDVPRKAQVIRDGARVILACLRDYYRNP